MSLLQLSLDSKNDALFRGAVTIEGDTQLGQDFQDFLSELQPDWEEALAQLSNDVLAHKTASWFRNLSNWGKQAVDGVSRNLSEYLQVESGLTPQEPEVQPFLKDVDDLRSDTERLAARIKRLREQLNS